nr:hypothetical protein [uncultured Mucilaginibacter sp.]
MQSNQITAKGGAEFGFARSKNAVTLTADKNKLEINAQIIGKVVFMPSDIVSIEPNRSGFSLGSQGIRVTHNVAGYRKKIIFYPKTSAAEVIRLIQSTGFMDNKSAIPYDIKEEVVALQAGGSFPIKTGAAIFIILFWNVAMLFTFKDFFFERSPIAGFGLGGNIALGFMLLVCLSLLTLEPARQLMLKPGHNVRDFKYSLLFIMAIVTVMLVMSNLLPHIVTTQAAK